MEPIHIRPLRSRGPLRNELPTGLAALDPLLARLYAARGITTANELVLDLKGMLPVGALHGVYPAVELLLKHREQRIVVIGDFDADGATSSALVVRCLRDFGFANIDYLVPNRFEYGYGLSAEIVRVAAQTSPALLVTVDNGISSVDGVAAAAALGIEVLITDHHLPGKTLPDAQAIVNPNAQTTSAERGTPGANLAGIGVAFYLMAALGKTLQDRGHSGAARIPARYLDLVALGTVADVVPLDHTNRILVTQGLLRIRSRQCVPGILALLSKAGRDPARTVSADLGFTVGPRLNAAGRLDDISVGIECLLADDPASAGRLATVLDGINSDRREIETGMREQAFAFVDAMSERGLPACVCVFDRSWHQGVVGLIAARVRERCHRPVIAFARDESGQFLKGSARSVPGVHIRDLLEAVATARPGIIDKFGGHAMAAGLSLKEQQFQQFSSTAAQQLTRLYPQADFSGALLTDGELPAASLTLPVARLLRDGGPWGAGFPEPVWQGDFAVLEQRTVGERHLKLRVRPLAGSSVLDAIAFNQAGPVFRGSVRLVYRLDVNEWRGVESPQLVVEQVSSLEHA
ncbi:MAG: single-stranded-DNA-specific exonuclease RecJ [Woeseia sp.]